MNASNKPSRSKSYQNFVMDSTHWDNFVPREDDVVISTSYKSGTTWMQGICAALVFQSKTLPAPMDKLSPWLDARFKPGEETLSYLGSIQHRRFIKSHLPLNGLPYFEKVKYIVVGRDGMDVFMSFWNHWNNMKLEAIDELNSIPNRVGPGLPHPPENIVSAFEDWLRKSSIEGETEGYPFWSHLEHVKSWWDFRHLENIKFVHFNDLLADLDGQMREISKFLEIPVNENIWTELVDSVTFKSMKSHAEDMAPATSIGLWKDPSKFFRKGENKQWKNLLPENLVREYRIKAKNKLGPELEAWLEKGTLS